MPRLTLRRVRLAFPNIFTMGSVGDGEPAYGARFIIPPDHPQVKELDDAVAAAAKDKWGEKADTVLKMLIKDNRVAFLKEDYCNKKTGEPFDGFAGNFSLGARNGGDTPLKPSTLGADNQPITSEDGLIYGGAFVDASVEIYGQDNQYGRRINCNLRGVRFVGHGDAFGGGTKATADDFGAPVTADNADEFV